MSAGTRDLDVTFTRRALFALVALAGACTAPVPQHDAAERSHEEADDAVTKADKPSEPDRLNGLEAWEQIMARAPALDIPASLSGFERRHLPPMMRSFEARYEELGEVWESRPSCSPSLKTCYVEWDRIRGAIVTAKRKYEYSACAFSQGMTGTIFARVEAHERYLEQLSNQLEHALDELAASHGAEAEQAWAPAEKMQKPSFKRRGGSCILPPVGPVTVSVLFPRDSAELNVEAPELEDALSVHRKNGPGAHLVVRGHADSGEVDGDQLAERRAKAVVQWLLENKDVAPDSVEMQSFGSTYHVHRDARHRSSNQRVDFNVRPSAK